MPTDREREYYTMGFRDGQRMMISETSASRGYDDPPKLTPARPKRKLSAWNKFVKANSKKPRFVLRSGKLNLKKMGVAFRKTPLGKKKR